MTSYIFWTGNVGGLTNEQFATSASGGTVTSASSGNSATYYKQFNIPMSYSTSDTTSPTSSVTLSGTKSGNAAFTVTLTNTVQNIWLDSGPSWSVNSVFQFLQQLNNGLSF